MASLTIIPPRGKYALVTPLAKVKMSGRTPQCVSPNHSPVRPNPVMISSAIRSTSCRSRISRTRGK